MCLKNRSYMKFRCVPWRWILSLLGTSGKTEREQPYSNTVSQNPPKHASLLHWCGSQRVRLFLLIQSFGMVGFDTKMVPQYSSQHPSPVLWHYYREKNKKDWRSLKLEINMETTFQLEISLTKELVQEWTQLRSWGKEPVMINGCRVKSQDIMIHLRRNNL